MEYVNAVVRLEVVVGTDNRKITLNRSICFPTDDFEYINNFLLDTQKNKGILESEQTRYYDCIFFHFSFMK